MTEPPKTLKLNDRLMQGIRLLFDSTKKTQQETGGFLIRNAEGNIEIAGMMIGEDSSITLAPKEQIDEGEKFLGTIHVHHNTNYFSGQDIASFLADKNEKISMLIGNDASLRCLIKTSETELIPNEDIAGFKESYDMEDINGTARAHKFLHYFGNDGNIKYQEKTSAENEVDLDSFTKPIKGLPQIPLSSSRQYNKGIGLLDQRKFNRFLRPQKL